MTTVLSLGLDKEKGEKGCTASGHLEPRTPMGEHFSTNFSSCDLAVPGSPSISKLMSPLRVSPSGSLERWGWEEDREERW